MNPIFITAIIVFGIVLIVAMSLAFASKFKCKHEWAEGQQMIQEATDYLGGTHRFVYMLCRCKKCGVYKPFATKLNT